MTRMWVTGPPKPYGERPDILGWALCCDRRGCGYQSDTRPGESDLPLEEFQAAGWFIAAQWGDRCPQCMAAGLVEPDARPWRPLHDVPVSPDYL